MKTHFHGPMKNDNENKHMLFIFFIRNCFISTFISICRKRYLAYIYILNFLIKLLYCISLIVQCSFEIMSYFTTFFVISFQRKITNINIKSFCTNFLHKNQKVLATAITYYRYHL